MPFPLPAPIPLPRPGETTAILKELREHWARARRRAGEVEGEIGRGQYGSATGHPLLGHPYPPEIDSGVIFDNEAIRSPDLDALVDETEKDLEKRLNDPLDERHREDARNNLLGDPVIDSRGRTRRHDEEVANNANGLQDRADALDAKATHNNDYVKPYPDVSIKAAKALSARIKSILSDLNKEIPGLDDLRAEVRKTGTVKRSDKSPGM